MDGAMVSGRYEMIEIMPNLFVGNQKDFEINHGVVDAVVHACREPYHRIALGYTGKFPPKGHPEYCSAIRGNRLILNLVDADQEQFISKRAIDDALMFIGEKITAGSKLLVHCNQGLSRAPSIGLLFLVKYTNVLKVSEARDYMAAETAFKKIYPQFSPSRGMRGFMMSQWTRYSRGF